MPATPPQAARRQTSERRKWFVGTDEQSTGPFTHSEVTRRVLARQLSGQSWVWRPGLDAWARVADVPELAHLLPLSAPPNPPAPDPEAFFAADAGGETAIFVLDAGLAPHRAPLALAAGCGALMLLFGSAWIALGEEPSSARPVLHAEPVVVDASASAPPLSAVESEAVTNPDHGSSTVNDAGGNRASRACLLEGACSEAPRIASRPRRARPRSAKPRVTTPTLRASTDAHGAVSLDWDAHDLELDVGPKAPVSIAVRAAVPTIPPDAELNERTVGKIIGASVESARQCVDEALRAGEQPSGRRTLAIELNARGKVTRARVLEGQRLSAFNRCAARAAARWRFPASGAPASIDVPLIID